MQRKIRITVLDGYALNPGDLDWSALAALGDCTIYDRTPPERLAERARGADVLLTNKTPLGREILSQLPDLRYIGVLATGYNVVDGEAARERGIPVCNVRGYGTASVVQLTFALLLALTHRVEGHSEAVRAGRWAAAADWCFWEHPLTELAGKTMGIIGMGDIGRRVASVARAFGMEVVVAGRPGVVYPASEAIPRMSLLELPEACDVVSIHCPLTSETEGMVDWVFLSRMRATAFLLNTSRGPVVREADLAAALDAGVIAGAGLDVLSLEPPRADNPLFLARNCIITPHIAWATREARMRLLSETVGNLRSWLVGSPRNVVNGV